MGADGDCTGERVKLGERLKKGKQWTDRRPNVSLCYFLLIVPHFPYLRSSSTTPCRLADEIKLRKVLLQRCAALFLPIPSKMAG